MKETWTTCANALGQVLKEWRTSNGITLYSIAKYGATRVENIKKVEDGVANMITLARYLDYISTKDDVFFDNVLYIWQDKMEGRNKGNGDSNQASMTHHKQAEDNEDTGYWQHFDPD